MEGESHLLGKVLRFREVLRAGELIRVVRRGGRPTTKVRKFGYASCGGNSYLSGLSRGIHLSKS